MKIESECCEKFRSKAKACKGCPVVAPMPKKERRRFLRQWKKKRKK